MIVAPRAPSSSSDSSWPSPLWYPCWGGGGGRNPPGGGPSKGLAFGGGALPGGATGGGAPGGGNLCDHISCTSVQSPSFSWLYFILLSSRILPWRDNAPCALCMSIQRVYPSFILQGCPLALRCAHEGTFHAQFRVAFSSHVEVIFILESNHPVLVIAKRYESIQTSRQISTHNHGRDIASSSSTPTKSTIQPINQTNETQQHGNRRYDIKKHPQSFLGGS